MNDQTKGLLVTTLGVLCVVPDALFVRLIAADPLTIAFWRLFLAGSACGLAILFLQGPEPFRKVVATGRHGLVYMVANGASGVLFVAAVSLTSVANVVLIVATMPIFATIYSRVLLAEPISRRLVITMIFVMAGVAIIAYGSGETAHASLAGDALALCVSMVYAAALTVARMKRSVSMVPGAAMGYIGAALVLLPFAAPLSVPVDQTPLVVAHGLFILGSMALLAIGPRFISSAEVSLLILLETILAPLLAWAVIGEHPGAYALAGGVIVTGALLVSNLVALRRNRLRSRP